jgi:hypothetical protein
MEIGNLKYKNKNSKYKNKKLKYKKKNLKQENGIWAMGI